MHSLISLVALVVACVGTTLAVVWLTADSPGSSSAPIDMPRTITVTGEAEAFHAPDTASFSFSLTRQAPTVSAATASINERMSALLTYIDGFGIDENDVKTTSYTLNPEYSFARESGERQFTGYRADQRVEIVVRDLEKVEQVLGGIGQQGVDQLSQLEFFLDDDAAIKAEVQADAIAQAKEKAQALGKDLGVRLTKIVGFSEGGQGDFPPVPYAAQSFEQDDAVLESAALPVGENELSSRVSITFEIE